MKRYNVKINKIFYYFEKVEFNFDFIDDRNSILFNFLMMIEYFHYIDIIY